MKKITVGIGAIGATLVLTLTGCAAKPPLVPAALQPPPGETLYLQAYGVGFQIYECDAKPGTPVKYEWTFTGPNAILKDGSGKLLGWHYVGPTWKNVDGSSVVGEVRARDPGPDPTAIPWLLLGTEAGPQAGAFSAATSVQRVQTKGGIAPADGCDEQNKTHTVQIPYTATYLFYRAS